MPKEKYDSLAYQWRYYGVFFRKCSPIQPINLNFACYIHPYYYFEKKYLFGDTVLL